MKTIRVIYLEWFLRIMGTIGLVYLFYILWELRKVGCW